MPGEIHIPFTRKRIGRFHFLLVSISLTLGLRPFLEGTIGIEVLMDIFVTLILASGLYAASRSKRLFYIGLLIVSPAVVARWLSYFVELPFLDLVGKIFGAIFFTFLVVLVLNYLIREKEITADIIAGAICGYLLIGLMWANFFSILEILQPGSFDIPENASAESSYFTYYSYVTLTTVGFGDITPITDRARSLSVLEAIVGPIYLAILVARLVGMSISQSIGKESRRAP
ncbi:MAG: potassium channel family protein [Planctomycetota bacterium]|jgi:hypothetical protein